MYQSIDNREKETMQWIQWWPIQTFSNPRILEDRDCSKIQRDTLEKYLVYPSHYHVLQYTCKRGHITSDTKTLLNTWSKCEDLKPQSNPIVSAAHKISALPTYQFKPAFPGTHLLSDHPFILHWKSDPCRNGYHLYMVNLLVFYTYPNFGGN